MSLRGGWGFDELTYFIASDALAIIEKLLLRHSLDWPDVCYYDKKYHTQKVSPKKFVNSEDSV